jgi:hypothetical protein
MAPINDGGPAFPQASAEVWHQGLAGMSLRDYFAAKALQGMMADGSSQATVMRMSQQTALSDQPALPTATLARICYTIAESMLAERERAR